MAFRDRLRDSGPARRLAELRVQEAVAADARKKQRAAEAAAQAAATQLLYVQDDIVYVGGRAMNLTGISLDDIVRTLHNLHHELKLVGATQATIAHAIIALEQAGPLLYMPQVRDRIEEMRDSTSRVVGLKLRLENPSLNLEMQPIALVRHTLQWPTLEESGIVFLVLKYPTRDGLADQYCVRWPTPEDWGNGGAPLYAHKGNHQCFGGR